MNIIKNPVLSLLSRHNQRKLPNKWISLSLALILQSFLPMNYATATSKVKVMSLGDSLCANNIKALRSTVERTKFGSRIDWVGTKQDGSYKDPANECRGGWSAAQVLQKPGANVRLPAWEKQPGSVRDWVASTKPDIVLIMIGTNDFFGSKERGEDTSKSLKESLQGIINSVYSVRPNATIVVASIPPFKWNIDKGVDRNKTKTTANAFLQQLVRRLSAQKKRIVFLDMHAAILARLRQGNIFENDGLHFNAEGNKFMAEQWTNALMRVMQEKR
ncbi:MAG TPA: GDSL-type esterase/lipase family protein [Leptolyngbyaceae cyanobacterium]